MAESELAVLTTQCLSRRIPDKHLFLHYAFDAWMNRTFPGVPWCRYADDGLIHCETSCSGASPCDFRPCNR
jgi:retron-type reverse transcriptase